MIHQHGLSAIEMAMLLVIIVIISMLAIPSFTQSIEPVKSVSSTNVNTAKVKSAFALAIAEKGDFPSLGELINNIDADFTSETNDLSGVIFRDSGKHVTVLTYNDDKCSRITNNENPGVSDIVRCIH